MSFQNLYYKRTTGTAKACYVCYKPTTTVLATINTTDFLYTCPGHLNDANFANKVKEESTKSHVTAEEIEKVKKEWEEKERKKKEKEEAAAKADKDKKEKTKEDDKANEDSSKNKSPPPPAPVPAPAPVPSHERYILHRDFFAMRQAEHRRRRQAAQVQTLGPRLPGVPKGVVE